MVVITRQTDIKRVVKQAGISRGISKPRGVRVTRITRQGVLKRKSQAQVLKEKYERLGYSESQKNGVVEYRAPKTTQYMTSYDAHARRGSKKGYGVYSPKSVYVDAQGKVVKEVDRGAYKFDTGGGVHIGKIYDSKVVEYGSADGHTTREEKTFREHEDKILPYQTNYYVDDAYVGRDWGSYSARYRAAKQKKIDVLQQKRAERKYGKEAVYVSPTGAYDFSGVKGKDSQKFDKELIGIFNRSRQKKASVLDVPRNVIRNLRPSPAFVKTPIPWDFGLGITKKKQKPIIKKFKDEKVLPKGVMQQSGVGIMAQQIKLIQPVKVLQPINGFSNNLDEKIYGKKKSKKDFSKLI